jgi:hypothetical protein
MRVYVANASLQKHLFCYRIPEVPQLRSREIPPMGQAVLPDDMNQMQIDALLTAMEPYGLVSVEDVKSKRYPKRFTRLVYSVDRPVSEVIIAALYGVNQDAMKIVSQDVQKQIAYESSREITQEVERKQREDIRTELRDLEFTIQEEEPSTGYNRPEKDLVGVGYKVAQTAEQQERRGRGRPRRQAAH